MNESRNELDGANEGTIEQNERTGSKPWVGRTASEFAVGLTRTTTSDSSGDEGDFGNSWKRSNCTDRYLNEETVPPYTENTNERPSSFASLFELKRNLTKRNHFKLVVPTKAKTTALLRISVKTRRSAFLSFCCRLCTNFRLVLR